MFVGTCSDAGKSILNTAFCRIFKQDGYRPAPFKAQNMSLNSYSTPEGGEIGRAQAVQAEACGILPHTDMNPVLLKPSTDQTSQVILNGKAVGNISAREYFRSGNKTQLFTEAVKAFHRLKKTIILLYWRGPVVSPSLICGTGILRTCGWRKRWMLRLTWWRISIGEECLLLFMVP